MTSCRALACCGARRRSLSRIAARSRSACGQASRQGGWQRAVSRQWEAGQGGASILFTGKCSTVTGQAWHGVQHREAARAPCQAGQCCKPTSGRCQSPLPPSAPWWVLAAGPPEPPSLCCSTTINTPSAACASKACPLGSGELRCPAAAPLPPPLPVCRRCRWAATASASSAACRHRQQQGRVVMHVFGAVHGPLFTGVV